MIKVDCSQHATICDWEYQDTLSKLFENTVTHLKIQNDCSSLCTLFKNMLGFELLEHKRLDVTAAIMRELIISAKKVNVNLALDNIREYFTGEHVLKINSESVKVITNTLVYVLTRLNIQNDEEYSNLKNKYVWHTYNSFKSGNNCVGEKDVLAQNMNNSELIIFLRTVFFGIKTIVFTLNNDTDLHDIKMTKEFYLRLTLMFLHFDWLYPNFQDLAIEIVSVNIISSIEDLHKVKCSKSINSDSNSKINNLVSKLMKFSTEPTSNLSVALNKTIFFCFLLSKTRWIVNCKQLSISMPYAFQAESVQNMKSLYERYFSNSDDTAIIKENCHKTIDIKLSDLQVPLHCNFHYLSLIQDSPTLQILNIKANIFDSITFMNILALIERNTGIKDLSITILPDNSSYFTEDFICYLAGNAIYSDKLAELQFQEFIMPSIQLHLEILINLLQEKSINLKHLSICFDIPQAYVHNSDFHNCMIKFFCNLLKALLNKFSQVETLIISSRNLDIDPTSHPILLDAFQLSKYQDTQVVTCLKSLILNFKFYKFSSISNFLNKNIEYLELNSLDCLSFLFLFTQLETFRSLQFLSLTIINSGLPHEESMFLKFFNCKKPQSLRNVEIRTTFGLSDKSVQEILGAINYDCTTSMIIDCKLKIDSVLLSKLLELGLENSEPLKYNDDIKPNSSRSSLGSDTDINHIKQLSLSLKSQITSMFPHISIAFHNNNTIEFHGLKCSLKKKSNLKFNIYDPTCLGILLLNNILSLKITAKETKRRTFQSSLLCSPIRTSSDDYFQLKKDNFIFNDDIYSDLGVTHSDDDSRQVRVAKRSIKIYDNYLSTKEKYKRPIKEDDIKSIMRNVFAFLAKEIHSKKKFMLRIMEI